MADLLEQISKDMRQQQLTQKEIAGQMLMYSIFIAFAGLIAAPVLYGLTSQMIVVTDTVWKGILAQNPGGLPTTGISFLKPSPPKITADTYHDFSLAAIIIICGFASLIMSAISSGSAIKGLKLMPVFIVAGIVILLHSTVCDSADVRRHRHRRVRKTAPLYKAQKYVLWLGKPNAAQAAYHVCVAACPLPVVKQAKI